MDVLLSIIFAFGAMIFWGVGDFFIQRTTRAIGNIEALAWIGIIGSIGITPFILEELPSAFTTSNLIFLATLGLIVFLATIFNFEALKKGKLSVIDVVLTLELPITIILSVLFFSEIVSMLQAIMILFTLTGIIIISTKEFSIKKHILEKGVYIALIAALLTGAVNFMTATGAKMISPLLAIWFPWIIMTILCVIIISYRKGFNTFSINFKKHKRIIIYTGIFDTTAWLFYAYAVQDHAISIITAIAGGYPAIALLMGLWFNKETINWHQYLGATMALTASFVLATTL